MDLVLVRSRHNLAALSSTTSSSSIQASLLKSSENTKEYWLLSPSTMKIFLPSPHPFYLLSPGGGQIWRCSKRRRTWLWPTWGWTSATNYRATAVGSNPTNDYRRLLLIEDEKYTYINTHSLYLWICYFSHFKYPSNSSLFDCRNLFTQPLNFEFCES